MPSVFRRPAYVFQLPLLLSLLLGVAVHHDVMAQETAIRGRAIEGASGQPIAGATVALWTPDESALITGAVSGDDGAFLIDGVDYGRYRLAVSFVGFLTEHVEVQLSAADPSVDVGNVRLAADAQELDEVQVEAERDYIEVGIDRMVYNTREQLVSIGGNATNVLENIPSIETDIDGNLSLRGNQNVAVLINGKPSPMTGEALTTFLEGLSADVIERVEVIPNPSSRYDPEGMAGIINIILREDREPGFNGGISATAGLHENYGASINASYQAGRWGFYGSYGYRTSMRTRDGWRHREERYVSPSTILEQENFSERDRESHNLNTSVSYDFTPQSSLSLETIVSRRHGEQTGWTAYEHFDDARIRTDHYRRTSDGDGRDLNIDYRIRFDHVIDRGSHEFSAELSFDDEREDDREAFDQEVFLDSGLRPDLQDVLERERQEERQREWTLRLDYVRPFGDDGRFEAGYRGDLERLNSETEAERFDSGGWAPDPFRRNAFRYDENVHAGYGIIATTIGRIGIQAGVRAERAETSFDRASGTDRHGHSYFSLFPSAYLTYEMTEARSARLSYSKRVNRPRLWQMNPFDNNRDPLFRRVGNPALSPQYVHAFELSLTQFTEATTLSISPYVRRTVDVIRRIETVDEDGVTISTFENFDSRDSWGAEGIFRLDFGRRANAYTSLNVYRVVTDGSNVDADLSNDAYGFSTRTNATVNLVPDLALQVSHYYRAPLETERGRVSSRSSIDVALRRQMMDGRLNLSLRARDLFDQRNSRILRDDALYFQESVSNWDSRRVSVTLRYTFGESGRDGRRGPQGGPRDGNDDPADE